MLGKNIQALDFDNWYPLKQNLDFQNFVIRKAFSVLNGLDLMNILKMSPLIKPGINLLIQ